MKVKFLYNTLLTVGIVLMFLSAIAAYREAQHVYMAISIAIILVLFWLKMKLLKDVRASLRNKNRS